MIVLAQKNTRIYETVYEQMINIIEDGTWKEGDRIPGEIELAKRFKISRNSLRMAIKVLHASEILESKPGLGTFVADDALKKIKHQKIMNFIHDETDFGEILETRFIIEKETAAIAAERRTAKDIKDLEAISKKVETALKNRDFDKAIDYGCDFHRRIIEITGNHILMNMYESMLDGIKAEKRQKLNEMTVEDICVINANRDREIIAAIKDKDGERARTLLEQHFIDKETINKKHKK
ncbi:MAG: FadR/GntR family transcriptional regulator [Sedimentibacter sp.]